MTIKDKIKIGELRRIVDALNHFGTGPRENVSWRFAKDKSGPIRYNISRSLMFAQDEFEKNEKIRQDMIRSHMTRQNEELGEEKQELTGEFLRAFSEEWTKVAETKTNLEARLISLKDLDLDGNAYNCAYLGVLLHSGHIIDDANFDTESKKEDPKKGKKPDLKVVGEADPEDESEEDDD